MLVLGIESSTAQVGVAIGSEQGIVASSLISRGVSHSEFVLPAVNFLLERANLSYRNLGGIAVGRGPGLFSGLRVGLTTAKTIAQVLMTPIVALPSLDLVAFEARYSDRLICPMLDARRGEVFFAFYRKVPGGVQRISDYMLGSPEVVAAELDARGELALLAGNAAALYRKNFESSTETEFASTMHAFPRACALVELAVSRLVREEYDRLFDVSPIYLRPPNAKIRWGTRRAL